MIHIGNTNIYKAEKGCFIVRKADGFMMGENICLGSSDSIDNYEDRAYTEESYREFYISLGYREDEIPSLDDNEETEEEV